MPTVKTQMKVDRLHQSGAADNQILKYNDTTKEWEPADSPSGADGNGIYTGSGTIGSGVASSTTNAKLPSGAGFNFQYNNNNTGFGIQDGSGDLSFASKAFGSGATFTDIDVVIYGPGPSIGINGNNIVLNESTLFNTTANVDPVYSKSIAEFRSTTKGILLPRLSASEFATLGTGTDGLMLYNTDTDTIKLYANSTWIDIGAGDGNGIYSGSGTIAPDATATLPDNKFFKIRYFNEAVALDINDQFDFVRIVSPNANAIIRADNSEAKMNFNANIISADTNSIDISFNTNVHQLIADSTGFRFDSTTKMVRPPRMTTTQRNDIVTPEEGGLLYNTTTQKLTYRNATAFIEVANGAAGNGGIYGGDGTVPNGTDALCSGSFTFQYSTGSEALSIVNSLDSISFQSKDAHHRLKLSNTNIQLYTASGDTEIIWDDTTEKSEFLTYITNLGGTIDPKAILDVASTTKAFFPPRMTTGERDAMGTVNDGAVLYDTSLDALTVRANGAWAPLAADVAGKGGIYKGSGTIPPGTTATLAALSNFTIDYSNGNLALQISSGNAITLQSEDTGEEIILSNTGSSWESQHEILFTGPSTVLRSDVTDIQRAFYLTGVDDPASFSTTRNDWVIVDNATIIRTVSTVDSTQITGIAGGVHGRVIYLVNTGTNSFRLMHDNAGSAAANRILLGAAATTVAVGYTRMLWYDSSAGSDNLGRWRYMEPT